MDSSGGCSPVMQALVHDVIDSGELNNNIIFCRQYLMDAKNAMCTSIDKYLKEYVEYVEPMGGYFVWLKLHNNYENIDSMELQKYFQVTHETFQ